MALPLDDASRQRALRWMEAEQARYFAPHFLAEACAMALDLAGPDGTDIPEALYELALTFFPEWEDPLHP
jgi:hypothetical protein